MLGGAEPAVVGKTVRLSDRCVREAYSGRGRLTQALERRGWHVLPDLEAYPDKGLYAGEDDLDLPHVVGGLLRHILQVRFAYIHFGTPCTTWGNLAGCNGRSRARLVPQGTDVGKRADKEAHANRQVDSAVRICLALSRSGALWGIEIPADSCMWFCSGMLRLRDKRGFCEVRFDQCQYGLQLSSVERFCRKRTSMLANFDLGSL